MSLIHETSQVQWKPFILTAFKSLSIFYVTTLLLALYFIRLHFHPIFLSVFLVGAYLLMIAYAAKQIFKHLSLATIMLIIPIAPLVALIIVVSLIPVLEKL